MPRPKKEEKKPVEKSKAKATAKRRKDKEEDADDLEEFEEKPEKKLKVEAQKKGNGKAKVWILTYCDRKMEYVDCGTHTFNSLASALEFREGLIKRLEGEAYEEFGGSCGIPIFDKKSKEHVYFSDYQGGSCCMRIKEVIVDELLAGKDVNLKPF